MKNWILLILILLNHSVFANVFEKDNRAPFFPTEKPWAAIGKLQIGNGICTGTLVGPQLVITAAHCVVSGGVVVKPASIQFYPGYYKGFSLTWSAGTKIHVGSLYPKKEFWKDWALIEIDQKLGNQYSWLVPSVFRQADLPIAVSHVGYSYDYYKSEFGHFQNGCRIHEVDSFGSRSEYQLYYHDCDMHGGASGGPIIAWLGGYPFLVAINVAESIDPQTKMPYPDGVKYTKKTANVGSGVFSAVMHLLAPKK